MVIYDLVCDASHSFEGWFKSKDDFNHQQSQELIICPTCESKNIRKLPTASYVSTAKASNKPENTPALDEQNIMQEIKNYIISNTEDVGDKFAHEAKKIHYGEAEARNIRGYAKSEEIHTLNEEGIKVIGFPGTLTDKQKLN